MPKHNKRHSSNKKRSKSSKSIRKKEAKKVQVWRPHDEDEEFDEFDSVSSGYDAVDEAIDAALLDLTGIDCDSGAIRETATSFKEGALAILKDVGAIQDSTMGLKEVILFLLKQQGNSVVKFKNRLLPPPPEQTCFDDGDDNRQDSEEVSNEVAGERAFMMLHSLDFEASRSPLPMTSEIFDQISQLPEKKVTLYIRMDEEMPNDSCTAYEVNLKRYHNGKTKRLFRYFRICSRHEEELSRQECIAGTFAAACLHPYSILPGSTQECDPFRPKTLLLDQQEDADDPTLRMLLTQMGLLDCQKAETRLQVLHDLADLDCFSEIDNNMMTLDARLANMQFEDSRDDDHGEGSGGGCAGFELSAYNGGGCVTSKHEGY